MELVLERKWKKSDYTIGILLIDNKKFCEVIEDKDRGLKDSMTTEQIKLIKKPNMTAIPTGTYDVTLDVFSSKFGNIPFYKPEAHFLQHLMLHLQLFHQQAAYRQS